MIQSHNLVKICFLGRRLLCFLTEAVRPVPTQFDFLLLSKSIIQYGIKLPSSEGRWKSEDQRTLSFIVSCQIMLCQEIPPKSDEGNYKTWISHYSSQCKKSLQLYQSLIKPSLMVVSLWSNSDGFITSINDPNLALRPTLQLRWVESWFLFFRMTRETATKIFVRQGNVGHRRPICIRAELLRLNVYISEVAYRFKTTTAYSKLRNGVCETLVSPQTTGLYSHNIDSGHCIALNSQDWTP